jgi:ABC-type lipoprotein release transport system permease subunit
MLANPAKLLALVRMSLRSLMLHRLRSLLTILGLMIGVASVIIMLAIAEGAGKEAQRNIESLGIRNVIRNYSRRQASGFPFEAILRTRRQVLQIRRPRIVNNPG